MAKSTPLLSDECHVTYHGINWEKNVKFVSCVWQFNFYLGNWTLRWFLFYFKVYLLVVFFLITIQYRIRTLIERFGISFNWEVDGSTLPIQSKVSWFNGSS